MEAQKGIIFKIPDFVETPTAKKVMDTLLFARSFSAMVPIVLGPGMGKTTCIDRAMSIWPGTFKATMRTSIRSPNSMMRSLARQLGIKASNAEDRIDSIGLKVKRDERETLLMVDEAQSLSEDAINELRYLKDVYKVGIALLGNADLNAHCGGLVPREGYGQIHRRMTKRITELKPHSKDIATYIAACGFEDKERVQLLTAIGKKPGAIGQIVETLKLASVLAARDPEAIEISADDIRRAWNNRGEDTL